MCHVGYPSIGFGDEFYQSNEREYEKNLIDSKEFNELLNKHNIGLSSYK